MQFTVAEVAFVSNEVLKVLNNDVDTKHSRHNAKHRKDAKACQQIELELRHKFYDEANMPSSYAIMLHKDIPKPEIPDLRPQSTDNDERQAD
ncbi:TPA: hypothetical protein ACH3X2_003125 [Trebouxia sp. C0005]